MHIGLVPGHIVLDGDPSPPPIKGHRPQFSADICCGQMARWINMPLGKKVDIDPSDIVLDGDPALRSPKKGQPLPVFGPCLLWPNGCIDQDATWYGGRPQPRPHCARWGPNSRSPKRCTPPIFGPCLLRPNSWMDQDATWYYSRPRPGQHYVRCGPSCTSRKGTAPSKFRPLSVVAKLLDGSRCHFVRR